MRISLITPSYNQADFITRTIDSVLSQAGNFEIEYIVVDGGSTDATTQILEYFQQQLLDGYITPCCHNIDFLRSSNKDQGQSDAINKGLNMATGDILGYLNSDDTLEPGALHLVTDVLGGSDKMRSYGKCHIINIHDQEIRKLITRYKNLIGRRYSYAKLLRENFISQMTVFWKREAMERVGFFDLDEHLCMDYEYWLRLGAVYDPVYIPEYIANFRFYHTSKSGARFVQQFKDELRLAKQYAKGQYPWSLLLHHINYYKIICIYRILSLLKL